jgi:hypothetical protein
VGVKALRTVIIGVRQDGRLLMVILHWSSRKRTPHCRAIPERSQALPGRALCEDRVPKNLTPPSTPRGRVLRRASPRRSRCG